MLHPGKAAAAGQAAAATQPRQQGHATAICSHLQIPSAWQQLSGSRSARHPGCRARSITPALRYFFPALANIGTKVTGQRAWDTSVMVEIGNPHCVTFVSDPRQLPNFNALRECDDALRPIAFRTGTAAAPFAGGANLQWAWPETRTRLRLSIYERGEGPTAASGSSACAAACAAYALNLVERRVDVVMPGGTLAISVDGPRTSIKSVTLAGFAAKTLDGIAILPPDAPN